MTRYKHQPPPTVHPFLSPPILSPSALSTSAHLLLSLSAPSSHPPLFPLHFRPRSGHGRRGCRRARAAKAQGQREGWWPARRGAEAFPGCQRRAGGTEATGHRQHMGGVRGLSIAAAGVWGCRGCPRPPPSREGVELAGHQGRRELHVIYVIVNFLWFK